MAPDLTNTDALHAHVAMLHGLARGHCGKLVVASYGSDPDTGNAIPPKVRHFEIGDVDGMAASVRELGAEPLRNVYVPLVVMRPDLPAGLKGGLADIVAVLGLVGDFDDNRAADYLGRLPLPPDYVLETSARRFQAFFLFSEPVAADADTAALVMRLKLHAGCDHGTADLSHVWRLAGTLNWPNRKKVDGGRPAEPQRVRVAKPWDGSRTDPDALDAALPALPAPSVGTEVSGAPVVLDNLPDDLRRLVVEGAPQGERSAKFHLVVKTLSERGADAVAVEKILAAHPGGIAAKYAGRLRAEIERAISKPPNRQSPQEVFTPVATPKPRSRFNVRAFSEIAPTLDRLWLVDGMIPAGGLGMMYGASNVGKSFLALDLALAVSRGEPWLGFKTLPGAALYVSAEGSMANRVEAYRVRHRLAASASLPFGLVEDSINLRSDKGDAAPLVDAARAFSHTVGAPLHLVIVDTLARALAGGNENDSQDISELLAQFAAIQHGTGAAVLVIHHVGKDQTRGARGHSSLLAAVDVALEIKRGVVRVEKQRDGETGRRVGYRLAAEDIGAGCDGERVTSAVVEPINHDARDAFGAPPLKSGSVEARALDILKSEIAANGIPAPGVLDLGEAKVTRFDNWRAAAGQIGLSRGGPAAQRKAFQRAAEKLIPGHVARHNDFVWPQGVRP